jgi:hypothetical protein
MSDPRTFVSSLVEESLGLMKGHLDRYPIPQDLVEEISSVVRGGEPSDIGRPVIEERLAALLAQLRETAVREEGFFVRKTRWPGAAPFAVCLTHDVDNISRPLGHVWKTRSRFGLPGLIGGLLGVTHLYNNVGLISKREAQHAFRSSFYFMSSNYPLGEVRKESDRIRTGGWDVGLHGDFGTHDSLEAMYAALSRFSAGLGFKPAGLREHYLKFDFSKSWGIMEEAGFDYDTTVGTNDRLGFRLGMASPFHPPDRDWAPLNLLELPLVLMDTTLWGYLKKSEEDGYADTIRLMEMVYRTEGVFTLLWHQEAVRMRGGRIYWRLLKEFKSRGCFVGSGAEIAHWWRVRAVPLVRDGKLIRLGADPPKDLVMRLDVEEGRKVEVRSGSVEGDRPRWVRPTARGFAIEVS